MFRRWKDGLRVKRPISRHLYDRFMHKYFAHDVNFELQLLARREAALYIRRHMAAANMYADRWRLLQAAVAEARPGGLFLEFGVEKGASADFIARLIAAGGTPGMLYAFDSFEGLPESWDGTFETRGKFTLSGKIPRLPSNVQIHKGWFDATLPGFRAANPEGRPRFFLERDFHWTPAGHDLAARLVSEFLLERLHGP